jgi:hypothetical protein
MPNVPVAIRRLSCADSFQPVAALFVVTFTATPQISHHPPDSSTRKQTKKKSMPTVQQSAPQISRDRVPQSSGTGGIKAGGETVKQPGRADPTPAKGAVVSRALRQQDQVGATTAVRSPIFRSVRAWWRVQP